MDLGKVRISTKVIGLIGLLGCVALLIAGIGIASLGSLNSATEDVTLAGDEGLAAARLRQAVIALNRAEFRIAAAPSVANLQDSEAAIGEQEERIQTLLAELRLTAEGERQQLLDTIAEAYRAYSAELELTLQIARQISGTVDISASQRRLVEEALDSRAMATQLEEAVKAFTDHGDARSEASAQQAAATYRTASWTMSVVALVGIVTGFCTALLISRKGIVQPIRSIVSCLRRLAEGDLQVEVYGTGRRDEIGEIAQTTQIFKENMLRNRELEAQQQAERQAQLARASAIEGLTNRFDADARRLLDTLASAATEMEATAQSLSAIAEETTRQSASVASASTQASANVQTVAAASEELGTSIGEISRQTGHSRTIARKATDQSRRANQLVEGLDAAGKRIGEVVALISGIASQTNLLALNATIEAARAGETGKGFAVVASEVKQLANQTSKATEEIASQIAEVQKVATDTASAIADITNIVAQMDEVSTSVASAVEQQSAATQEIGRNANEAARGTEEVSSTVNGIQEAATSTSSAASQVLSAARQLAQEAEVLRGEMGRFLAEVKAA